MLNMKKNINIPESELIELISSTVRTIHEQEEEEKGYQFVVPYDTIIEPNWNDPRESGPFFDRSHFITYYTTNKEKIKKFRLNLKSGKRQVTHSVYPSGTHWGDIEQAAWNNEDIQSIVKFYNNYACMECISEALEGKSPEQRKLTAREIERGVSGWVGSKHHPKVHYSLRGKATEYPEYDFDYGYGNIASDIFLELIKGGYTTNTYKAVKNTPEWKKLKKWLHSYFTDGKKLRTGDPKPTAGELAWTLQSITPMVLWCHNQCNRNE